mmetsp:Transcript_72730/g.121398  ORF Transcript_72730/g.121398 Transcript_72730/m.121398 type:complete len:241 (+) Transcript_72730:1441-2163(+)
MRLYALALARRHHCAVKGLRLPGVAENSSKLCSGSGLAEYLVPRSPEDDVVQPRLLKLEQSVLHDPHVRPSPLLVIMATFGRPLEAGGEWCGLFTNRLVRPERGTILEEVTRAATAAAAAAIATAATVAASPAAADLAGRLIGMTGDGNGAHPVGHLRSDIFWELRQIAPALFGKTRADDGGRNASGPEPLNHWHNAPNHERVVRWCHELDPKVWPLAQGDSVCALRASDVQHLKGRVHG